MYLQTFQHGGVSDCAMSIWNIFPQLPNIAIQVLLLYKSQELYFLFLFKHMTHMSGSWLTLYHPVRLEETLLLYGFFLELLTHAILLAVTVSTHLETPPVTLGSLPASITQDILEQRCPVLYNKYLGLYTYINMLLCYISHNIPPSPPPLPTPNLSSSVDYYIFNQHLISFPQLNPRNPCNPLASVHTFILNNF